MAEAKQEGQTLEAFEISVIVWDLDESMKQFKEKLGLVPYQTYDIELRPCILHGKEVTGANVKIAFYNAGPVRIELLQPAGGESIYQEFLDKHGVGVQHIGCTVKDFDEEMAFLKERGMGVVAIQKASEFSSFKQNIYLDSEDLVGFNFEIVEPK